MKIAQFSKAFPDLFRLCPPPSTLCSPQLQSTCHYIVNHCKSIARASGGFYQVPLKTRINLFKSLVLSHLDFSAIFFQNLPSYSIDRINKQINWGIKVCFMKTKYDTARDLLLETKILPAELQITRVSLNRFFNILQQTRNRSNKHFRFLENVPIIVNKRTHNLFLEQKCKSKWSNGSIVRNFIRKWNTLPITIRKETSKTKFKQKVTAEMLKRHERVPIDRRVAGFKHIFY